MLLVRLRSCYTNLTDYSHWPYEVTQIKGQDFKLNCNRVTLPCNANLSFFILTHLSAVIHPCRVPFSALIRSMLILARNHK